MPELPRDSSLDASVIAEGLVINGDLVGEGDVHLSGCLEGEVKLAKGELTVERPGFLKGRIEAQSVRLAGEVQGEIFAAQRVVIGSSAKVQANIATQRIEISEGAYIVGSLTVEEKAGK